MSAQPMTVGALLDEVGASRGLAHHRFETLAEIDPKPWYVQSAVAIVVWVGALVFASFLAAMGLDESAGGQVFFGVAFLAAGCVGAVTLRGLWRMHVCLVCYAATTSLSAMFAARTLHLGDDGALLAAVIAQLVCFAFIGARPVRFKALLGASLTMFAWVADQRVAGGTDLLILALAGLATFVWLAEARLGAGVLARAARPAGFALVTALLLVSLLSLLEPRGMDLQQPALLIGALGVLLVVVAITAAVEARVRAWSVPVALAIVCGAGLAALASDVPVLLTSLLVVALGRLRKEPVLEGLGAVSLAAFLWWVYYALHLSLLWTSFALFGAGVAILVARAVLLARSVGEAESANPSAGGSVFSPIFTRATRRSFTLAVPGLVVVGLVLGLAWNKEHTLAAGQTVILRLAPVDPRALMQGDYMVLDFEAARALHSEATDAREGVALLTLDADGVAHAQETIDAWAGGVRGEHAPLTDQRVRVQWHRVNGRPTFGAGSFFFAEGRGEHFAQARYAELRVARDGEAMIVKLLDVEKQALE
jgi:uncharacterized membrane-anchored protein